MFLVCLVILVASSDLFEFDMVKSYGPYLVMLSFKNYLHIFFIGSLGVLQTYHHFSAPLKASGLMWDAHIQFLHLAGVPPESPQIPQGDNIEVSSHLACSWPRWKLKSISQAISDLSYKI